MEKHGPSACVVAYEHGKHANRQGRVATFGKATRSFGASQMRRGALPRGGRYATYNKIYGVSSFESTCALLKFSSDQCVGSSPDILNS